MKCTSDVYCMFVDKMFKGTHTHTHTHSVVSWGLCLIWLCGFLVVLQPQKLIIFKTGHTNIKKESLINLLNFIPIFNQ